MKRNLRLIVCGGRDYRDRGHVWRVLTQIHGRNGIACIIQGGATGADALAAKWATQNGIPQEAYMADWETHGKAAGPLRNEQMLRQGNPDGVVAFPGGSGTAHMIWIAKEAGINVMEIA